LHRLDLSREVVPLFAGGDPTVDGTLYRFLFIDGRYALSKVRCPHGGFGSTLYAVDIETSLSTWGKMHVDESPVGPRAHGIATDTESVGCFPGPQKLLCTLVSNSIFHSG
jgi:hypothetical protein